MTQAPLIGINCDFRNTKNNTPAFCFLAAGYHQNIAAAGGIPVLVPQMQDPTQISALLDRLDGFVLTGGSGDLDPRKDGFMLHHSVQLMDPVRETFDRQLAREIMERRMPVFGIGSGLQLLNVTCGGNLFLDIETDLPTAIRHRDLQSVEHRHSLNVDSNSILGRVYGEGEIRVTSRHHMAIDELAEGFRITARCQDGVVEAIESEMMDWFAIGTQFHPEATTASALDIRIFEEFVEGVAAVKEGVLNGPNVGLAVAA
jgi:putative glutamine amidotransferase